MRTTRPTLRAIAGAALAAGLLGGATGAFAAMSMPNHSLKLASTMPIPVQFSGDPNDDGFGGLPDFLGPQQEERPVTIYRGQPESPAGYGAAEPVPPGPYSRQAPWVAPPGYYGGSTGAYRRDLQFCNNQPSRCY